MKPTPEAEKVFKKHLSQKNKIRQVFAKCYLDFKSRGKFEGKVLEEGLEGKFRREKVSREGFGGKVQACSC